MSNLAITAEPIYSENNNSSYSDTAISKKKRTHNTTQKNKQSSYEFNSAKVNKVLASIHNGLPDDDDDGNYVSAKHSENFQPMNPFNPPPKPVSMGSERTKNPDGDGLAPVPAEEEELDLQKLDSNFMNDAQVKEYYRRLVPTYTNRSDNNKPYYPNPSNSSNESFLSPSDNNQILIEKLNYMINLLEEQQDQKTSNVTEEVVLYSFLGVFIIFIVDSFARVGKYVR